MSVRSKVKTAGTRVVRDEGVRRATARMRILPSFLIVGAQRAGTTTLFNQLLRHSDVCGPGGAGVSWARKEIHFFDERFYLGPNWYRTFFPLAASRRVARLRGGDLQAGEATPYYMFHPLVPGRVAATVPDMRIFALLRNPVDRAYSHYQMMARSNREELSFEEALAAEEERLAGGEELDAGFAESAIEDGRRKHHHHRHHAYFARGLYAEQLARWLEHFPREQLFILEAEDFFARSPEIYPEVLDFLGLRRFELDSLAVTTSTASPGKPWSKKETRNRASYGAMSSETRAELEERYAEPNARLTELLGREFSWGPRRVEARS